MTVNMRRTDQAWLGFCQAKQLFGQITLLTLLGGCVIKLLLSNVQNSPGQIRWGRQGSSQGTWPIGLGPGLASQYSSLGITIFWILGCEFRKAKNTS